MPLQNFNPAKPGGVAESGFFAGAGTTRSRADIFSGGGSAISKRILSIDGGGIKGALTTCALVELEKQTGKLCREIFDYVAGTSTGALIASAIAAGLPATQILGIYQNRAKEIFNHSTDVAWALRVERGWAYDPKNVYKVLVSEFGSKASWKLNYSPIGILLTAKGINEHPWYFVRDTPKNAGTTGGLSLLDCAIASACAPTYFAPWYVNPAKIEVGWCFDGGTGVTGNPVYQACVEAFEYDGFNPTETRVISLGTGYFPNGTVNPPQGLLDTLTWTIDALVDAPIDQQTQIAQRQWPGMVQRFNWRLPLAIDMADVSAIPGLITLGQSVAAQMDWKKILSI